MIKGVIFDLDDTLVPEKCFIFSGFKEVCNYISIKESLNYDKLYRDCLNIFDNSSRLVFDRLLKENEIEYDRNYIDKLVEIYKNHKPKLDLYEDAQEILEYLYKTKIKTGIITDGNYEVQRNKIEALKLLKYIDTIVITDEIGKKYWKPHPKGYYICASRLNLKFKELLYIGDNEKKDFVTANRLGMKTAKIVRKEGIYYNLDFKEEGYEAKIIIHNLMEILNHFSLQK